MARTFLKGKVESLNDYARYDAGVALDVTPKTGETGTSTSTMYPDKIVIYLDALTSGCYFEFDTPVDIMILDGHIAHSSSVVTQLTVTINGSSLALLSSATSLTGLPEISRFFLFSTDNWDADCGDTIRIHSSSLFTGYLILSIIRG